jgi:excisionase family DNA binding protein
MIRIEDEKYVNVDEIAELLGLSKGTILNWVSSGSIPSIKLGKRRLFNLGSINTWLLENIR